VSSVSTSTGRQRILDVAAALVLDRGIDGVPLRQIADIVGMKASSLYYHFASKNEIVVAVFRQGIDVMERAWDDAADTPPHHPRARLAIHVRAHLSALFENGPFTAAHVTAFRTAPPDVRAEIIPIRDAYEARWTELLAELAAGGHLRPGTPLGLSRLALFGSMNSTIEWFDADRGNLDELAEVITTGFWDGFGS
jgi:AcrR family transcriptional regulator